MAWETGTAADHVDLLNKIRDFLTTNATLVGDGENWTQELGPTGTLVHGDQITLKGPGLTASDSIYCGLETLESSANDSYNIRFWGHAGYSDTLTPRDQPIKSPDQHILLWNQPMTYWIIANGRRWMLVVKVATVYSSAYCGFILPYASPSEYPYPMLVAGIAKENTRWSSEESSSRFFASPGYNNMSLFYPDNVWRLVSNYQNDNTGDYPSWGDDIDFPAFMYPTRHYYELWYLSRPDSPIDEEINNRIGKCFDGSYLLRDLTIISSANGGPYNAMMGILDGAFWVTGRENSSENIITKNGVDHLVVQNLFRNGFRDYMALRLQ